MRKARHVLDERNNAFVQTVVETSKRRQGHIDKGAILWRAQVGIASQVVSFPTWVSLREKSSEYFECEMPLPLPLERMTPLKDRAEEGRVNSKGIPCLYLSTDRDTAMTEVRPWIGSHVSVAQFIILRDLTVVDCSGNYGRFSLRDKEELPPDEREARVWQDINSAFSEPVTRLDDVAGYAPTQILAEAFRNAGNDGVIYGSKLGAGTTIAVFDLEAAELINCEWHQVKSVKLEFTDAEGMYCAEKYMDSDDAKIRDPTNPQYGRNDSPRRKKKNPQRKKSAGLD
jgi:RES domain